LDVGELFGTDVVAATVPAVTPDVADLVGTELGTMLNVPEDLGLVVSAVVRITAITAKGASAHTPRNHKRRVRGTLSFVPIRGCDVVCSDSGGYQFPSAAIHQPVAGGVDPMWGAAADRLGWRSRSEPSLTATGATRAM
jgi:hypothetical protein